MPSPPSPPSQPAATISPPPPLSPPSAPPLGMKLAKLTASDAAEGDQLGALHAVGRVWDVVCADPGRCLCDACHVVPPCSALSSVIPSFTPDGRPFGGSVAISGSTIVVGAQYDDDGASNSGSAYVFDTNGNQLVKLTASDAAASDYFGAHRPVPP
eukprot:35092-Prymnesium_polylepis.1